MSESYTIGSSPHADISIEGDQYLSPRHARVFRADDGQVWIEDLGSTNGTFVNGMRVTTPTPISPGDVVRVGRSDLPWKLS